MIALLRNVCLCGCLCVFVVVWVGGSVREWVRVYVCVCVRACRVLGSGVAAIMVRNIK